MATVIAPSTAPTPEHASSQPSPLSPALQLNLREVGNKGDERESEEACDCCHPDEHIHLPVAAQIGEAAVQALPHTLVAAQLLFGIVDANQRPQHGEKADAVEKEVSGHAEERHGIAAQRWPQDARHVELRGVERDGIGEVFALHQPRHQSLVAWRIHRHGHAVAESDGRDAPDGDQVEVTPAQPAETPAPSSRSASPEAGGACPRGRQRLRRRA